GRRDDSYCALGVERAWALRARRPRRLVGVWCRLHRRQPHPALGDRLERSTFAQRPLAYIVEVPTGPWAGHARQLSVLRGKAPLSERPASKRPPAYRDRVSPLLNTENSSHSPWAASGTPFAK